MIFFFKLLQNNVCLIAYRVLVNKFMVQCWQSCYITSLYIFLSINALIVYVTALYAHANDDIDTSINTVYT